MKLHLLAGVAALSFSTEAAFAAPSVWAVEAAATNAYAELFNPNGSIARQVNLGSDIDPRGIAIVGNTGYVAGRLLNATDNLSGIIRSFNVTTGAVIGNVTTSPLLGSLSFDGTGFWANDNGGGKSAYRVTLAGVQDQQVTLANCSADCSGLEYLTRNGTSYLIANRGAADASAVYDLYSTTGTLVTAGLLSVPFGTGVAYDSATDAFVVASSTGSDGDTGSLRTYSFGGALLSSATLGGPVPNAGFGNTRFLADIAAVNVATAVPEPMSLALLASSLGVLGLTRRRTVQAGLQSSAHG